MCLDQVEYEPERSCHRDGNFAGKCKDGPLPVTQKAGSRRRTKPDRLPDDHISRYLQRIPFAVLLTTVGLWAEVLQANAPILPLDPLLYPCLNSLLPPVELFCRPFI